MWGPWGGISWWPPRPRASSHQAASRHCLPSFPPQHVPVPATGHLFYTLRKRIPFTAPLLWVASPFPSGGGWGGGEASASALNLCRLPCHSPLSSTGRHCLQSIRVVSGSISKREMAEAHGGWALRGPWVKLLLARYGSRVPVPFQISTSDLALCECSWKSSRR